MSNVHVSRRLVPSTEAARGWRRVARATGAAAMAATALGASAAPASAEITATSLQPAAFSNVVVMNRYQVIPELRTESDGSQVPWPTTLPRDNRGHPRHQHRRRHGVADEPRRRQHRRVQRDRSDDLPSLAPGASTTVTVQFKGRGAGDAKTALFNSPLTIQASDGSSASMSLRGYWQYYPEHGLEPTLDHIVRDLFGFGTTIVGPGQRTAQQRHGQGRRR